MRHIGRLSRKLIAILTFCLILSMSWVVMASTGILTIEYAVDNEKTPISGAKFSAVMVAGYDEQTGMYIMESPFDTTGYDPNALDADKYKDIAEDLYDIYHRSRGMSVVTAVTDGTGLCSFLDMDRGLYLICQSSRSGVSVRYEMADPVVIYVDNNVKIYPKTEKIPTPSETSDSHTSEGGGGTGIITPTPTTPAPTTPISTTPAVETQSPYRTIGKYTQESMGMEKMNLTQNGIPLGNMILSAILPKTGEEAMNRAIGSMIIALAIITIWIVAAIRKKKGESHE